SYVRRHAKARERSLVGRGEVVELVEMLPWIGQRSRRRIETIFDDKIARLHGWMLQEQRSNQRAVRRRAIERIGSCVDAEKTPATANEPIERRNTGVIENVSRRVKEHDCRVSA